MRQANAVPRELLAALDSTSVQARLDAIEQVSVLARGSSTAPFDAILELLRARARADENRDVRRVAYTATRTVAIARARAKGLRNVVEAESDLFAVEDRQVVWGAIELVWDAVSIYEGPEILDAGLQFATRGQQAVYAVWWTQSEVGNGGFAQYFNNSTGMVVCHARDGLLHIGATELAAVVERAMALFPGGMPPADRAKRRALLHKLASGAFAAIDDEFYACAGDLFPLAGKYVRAHLAEFFEFGGG